MFIEGLANLCDPLAKKKIKQEKQSLVYYCCCTDLGEINDKFLFGGK